MGTTEHTGVEDDKQVSEHHRTHGGVEDDKQVSEHHRTYGGWRTTSRSVSTTEHTGGGGRQAG